jgi:hypothetical protein
MKTPPLKTGCWFGQIPDDHVRIGISRGTPRGFSTEHRLYRKLNPGEWFNGSAAEHVKRYHAEILCKLNARKVVYDLARIADGKVPVLCCFEHVGSGQWCHRALVASWLAAVLGIAVPELGHEDLPQERHPLLPRREGHPGVRLARHLNPSEPISAGSTSAPQNLAILTDTSTRLQATLPARARSPQDPRPGRQQACQH